MATFTDQYKDKTHYSTMSEYSPKSTQGKRQWIVLLFGPTGVGKSTFIKAFHNYMSHESLDEAINKTANVKAQSSNFTVFDKDKYSGMQRGSNSSENCTTEGQSCTRNCKEYCLQLKDCDLRMIDSPGISETLTIQANQENIENICKSIYDLGGLHAIFIVLKANESKLPDAFQYFTVKLLSRLENPASTSILFLFTHSHSTSYGPGATIRPLKTLLGQLNHSPPNLEIPFNNNNSFYFDNQDFHFLLDLKTLTDRQMYQSRWTRLRQGSLNLCEYLFREQCKVSFACNSQAYSTNDNAGGPGTDFSKPLSNYGDNSMGNIQESNTMNVQITSDSHSTKSTSVYAQAHSEGTKSDRGNEYNILLMGPTGVGKSTFINALANYLHYESLDDAVKYHSIALIPTRFSVSDENFKQRTVLFGSDPNENMDSKGQSATRSCKAHELRWNNLILRIIDTPGIGDTRGIDQDRKNVNEILSFLTNYVDLHAICILLKPNDSRLTPLFSFCIQQLLSRLHTNASNNIVFIYTNSRSTLYRPGETAAPLTMLLNQIRSSPPYTVIPYGKNNIFCLDNEAFRFLVAYENAIRFSRDDHENFGQSWSKSVVEVQRMIHYIVEGSNGQGLTPHKIQDTLTVSWARDAIIQLARPFSELTKNIQANIQILSRHMKEIQDCEHDEKKLKSKLYIPALNYEWKELGQPRTVCASKKCRKPQKIGNEVILNYPQICHNICDDVDGAEAQKHCQAFDPQSGSCRDCHCDYLKHLRISYEINLVPAKKVDPNVQRQLQTQGAMKQAAQDIVRNLQAQIQKYKTEEKILTNYSAKLATFLKQNGMIDCSDVFKKYLIELIEDEKYLSKFGAHNANIIEELERKLENYKTEQNVLETALRNQTSRHQPISAEDVQKIINEISNMEFSGNIFNKTMQAQNKAKGSKPHTLAGINSTDKSSGSKFGKK